MEVVILEAVMVDTAEVAMVAVAMEGHLALVAAVVMGEVVVIGMLRMVDVVAVAVVVEADTKYIETESHELFVCDQIGPIFHGTLNSRFYG